MSIDIGVSEPQPIEVVFEEVDSSMEVTLESVPVSIELDTPPELQVSINEVYSTAGGGGSGKSPYIGGNGNWFYYNDVTQQYIDSGVQAQGDDGVTFTPSVDLSGNISWTNNGGLPNPPTINIKGPAGNDGKSAYQSALDGGYSQSESQFNTDLSKVSNGDANTGVVNPSPIGEKDISTVKKLADAFDKASTCLLRTVSVPTNTTSVVINTTDTGVSFSSLDINQIGISVSGILVSDVVTSCFIGVNGLYAEPISNYYQTSTNAQPSGFLNIIRKFFTIHGIITAEGNDVSGFFSNWRATALNPLSNVVSGVTGIAKFGNIGGKITEVRIIVSGANFDAGTTIKITKLC